MSVSITQALTIGLNNEMPLEGFILIERLLLLWCQPCYKVCDSISNVCQVWERSEETCMQGSWEQPPFCNLNKPMHAAKLPRIRFVSRISLRGGGWRAIGFITSFQLSNFSWLQACTLSKRKGKFQKLFTTSENHGWNVPENLNHQSSGH